MSITIRPCRDSDITALAYIYKQAIRQMGRAYYTDAQVQVWSSFADDVEGFEKWINKSATYVAVDEESRVVGFAGLEIKGRISSLFVAPEVTGTGIGTALLTRIMDEVSKLGMNPITTDASEFSKPLFEKFGFKVKNLEQTLFKGMEFERYQMILTR